MSEPLQGILITSREIYDAVVRLTGRVDVLIEQQNYTSKGLEEAKKAISDLDHDHENRLRALEKARWPLPSLAALLAVASFGMAIFTAFNK